MTLMPSDEADSYTSVLTRPVQTTQRLHNTRHTRRYHTFKPELPDHNRRCHTERSTAGDSCTLYNSYHVSYTSSRESETCKLEEVQTSALKNTLLVSRGPPLPIQIIYLQQLYGKNCSRHTFLKQHSNHSYSTEKHIE